MRGSEEVGSGGTKSDVGGLTRQDDSAAGQDLGSRSLKRKEPHLNMIRLKSGSLPPRLTLGSPLLTPGSPYYKIINFTRRGTGLRPDSASLFLVPPLRALARNALAFDVQGRVWGEMDAEGGHDGIRSSVIHRKEPVVRWGEMRNIALHPGYRRVDGE